MSSLCCAASAVVLLTAPNQTFFDQDGNRHTDPRGPEHLSVEQCLERCGPLCQGVGDTRAEGPAGCEGTLYQGPDPKGGLCPPNTIMLRNFVANPHFGGTNSKGVCKAAQCVAEPGRVIKVASYGNRPIRVKSVKHGSSKALLESAVIELVKNRLPDRSEVVGPLVLRCTNHSSRLRIGAGSRITNVTVDCPGDCPLHVRLNIKRRKPVTVIEGIKLKRNVVLGQPLSEAELCAVLVSPVPQEGHPRDFFGRGDVVFKTTRGHNVAVANVNGELTIQNEGVKSVTVTLIDSIADVNGNLVINSEPSNKVIIHNMTALLGVFGEEYLIEFFNKGALRGYQPPKWMVRAIPILAGLVIVMIGSFPVERLRELREEAAQSQ